MENQFDPLGIHALRRDLTNTCNKLDKIEQMILSSMDMPITEEKVIEITGIDRPTLYRMRKSGILQSYKPGKKVMYLPSEVRTAIQKYAAF